MIWPTVLTSALVTVYVHLMMTPKQFSTISIGIKEPINGMDPIIHVGACREVASLLLAWLRQHTNPPLNYKIILKAVYQLEDVMTNAKAMETPVNNQNVV
jgi:hypothetical protein